MSLSLDQVKESKKTEVGSYFIANYPPFSFWKTEAISEFNEALLRAPVPVGSDPRPASGRGGPWPEALHQ